MFGMYRKTAGGNCGLCNHLCRFCNVYSNGEVMSCGNSWLFAYNGTKEQSYLRSLSHSLPFNPPPFPFRFCEQQWLIMLIYPDKEFPWSPRFSAFKKYYFKCLHSHFYFSLFEGNYTQSELDQAPTRAVSPPPHYWTHFSHILIEVSSFTYVETVLKHCLPPLCYSVFHHFLIILLSLPLSDGLCLNLKLGFHPNCVKLL